MIKVLKSIKYIRHRGGLCSLNNAEGCQSANVVIPEKVLFKGEVIAIDNNAFRNNNKLKSIVIPEGVVYVGEYAFENCKNLERIVLPQSLKKIGKGAFMHCEKLKEIAIPRAVSEVADDTFSCCYALRSIDLSHIRIIGRSAFAKCKSLRGIDVADDLKKIDATSFLDTAYYNQLDNWQDGLLYLNRWVIGCNGSSEEYTVRKNTVGIAANTFVEEQHVKHTRNPLYDSLLEEFEISRFCPQVPTPDFSGVPEYLEKTVPVNLCYEGTSKEWSKVLVLQSDVQIPTFVSTVDETVETSI